MLENCNNMAEVKKLKYNLLEKIYADVSDQKFNFNQIFNKVIKALKKEIPGIEIIDSERKLKIEQRYPQKVTVKIIVSIWNWKKKLTEFLKK